MISGDAIVLSDEHPSATKTEKTHPDLWKTFEPKQNGKGEAKPVFAEPRLRIGARILYYKKMVPVRGQERESAVAWCVQDDYFVTRKELIARPVYRLLKRWTETLEPVQNKELKTWTTPIEEHEDNVFEGSDLDALRLVLRRNPLNPMMRIERRGGCQVADVQWQWQKNINGHWHNCGHPLETSEEHQ